PCARSKEAPRERHPGELFMITESTSLFSTLTRRSFLKTASSVAAAGALGDSLDLLAQGAPKFPAIMIPAGAHPAVRSAAEMLAKKLGLSADAIHESAGTDKLI